MFDQWLTVAYRHEQQKTASRQMVDALKRLPNTELLKAAMGDPTSKLAYVDGPDDKSWLDKYKGSQLFSKAVELEKQLLQIDMAEKTERAEREANQTQKTDFYDQRDAIKLQQRMLDLELVMAEEGSTGDPEAKEEQGAQLIEQAQAQEAAQGKGGEPHEQAETAAIQQFRGAQQQEAAAAPKAEVKVAATLGSENRRIAPSSNTEVLHGGSTQGAGALGDYQPTSDDHFSTVAEGRQVDKTASVAAYEAFMQKVAKGPFAGYDTRREAQDVIDVHRGEAAKERAHSVRTRFSGGLGGATAGAITGHMVGHGNPRVTAMTAALGGLAGALKSPGGKQTARADKIEKHLGEKTSAVLDGREVGERNQVRAAVAKKYPALVRTKEAGIGAGIGGVLSAGKNLATTAFKAGGGGLSGVGSAAKSMGNVAAGFAKANPLTAAGVAGGAGLLAGRALAPRNKTAGLVQEVAKAPLG